MELFFSTGDDRNFGDDLNEWIWDHLLPGWRNWDQNVTLFGVGTLLNEEHLSPFLEKRILVAGSGAGYKTPYTGAISPDWDIRALRGPLSAQALGLDKTMDVLDPAIMIPELAEFQDLPRTGRTLFVPHHTSIGRHDWQQVCDSLDIDYVSPASDSKQVIRALGSASLVLAEAMHAAIIADAFRVPWIPVSISPVFYEPKWHDWSQSLGMHIEVEPLYPRITRLAAMVRQTEKALAPPRNSTGQATPSALPASPPRSGRFKRLRVQMRLSGERFTLKYALRQALMRSPRISDQAVLDRKRVVYREVLETIQREYGAQQEPAMDEFRARNEPQDASRSPARAFT